MILKVRLSLRKLQFACEVKWPNVIHIPERHDRQAIYAQSQCEPFDESGLLSE